MQRLRQIACAALTVAGCVLIAVGLRLSDDDLRRAAAIFALAIVGLAANLAGLCLPSLRFSAPLRFMASLLAAAVLLGIGLLWRSLSLEFAAQPEIDAAIRSRLQFDLRGLGALGVAVAYVLVGVLLLPLDSNRR